MDLEYLFDDGLTHPSVAFFWSIEAIKLWLSVISLASSCFWANVLTAQSLPNPLNLEPQLEVPNPLEMEPERDTSETIRVERFSFVGNTVFDSEQLQKVVAPYTGKDLTFAEILAARSAITNLYVQKGYTTSGALIPLQTKVASNAGIVTIQIVEGKLEEIDVERSDRPSGSARSDRFASYIRSRLPSGIVNQERLLEALRLLSIDPLIENISATLTAGTQPGLSILHVKVEPKEPISVVLVADNHRSPAAGTFERGVELSHTSLLIAGDKLNLTYKNTDGSNGIASSYKVPINPQNGTVELLATQLHSNIIEEPFNQLDIISRQHSYQLTFRQPLMRKASVNATQEFALGLSLARRASSSQLLGFNFPISPGADKDGRTRISSVDLFAEWNQQNPQEILGVRSAFSLGVGAFGATINPEAPDSRFLVWRGEVGWLKKWGDASLVLKGKVQLADRPLVPLEQFGLGGQETVRGYRQDLLIADNGVSASAEVYLPLIARRSERLQIVPFFDVGTLWNRERELEADTSTLASIGLGLQYEIGSNLTARLDYGIPLIERGDRNTWQENGLTFKVQYRPFSGSY